MGFTINRQMPKNTATINRSKKVFFLLSTVKMHIKINSKKFQGISNFAISSADLQGILAPEESINWKN